jgi:putative aldouronate transport system substrate-binding protein
MGELYTDAKLADLYTFGIEGVDYEYVKPEGDQINKVKKLEGRTYEHSMWESASATIVTPEIGEPDNKADLYIDFNGSAETSCAAGFRFNKTPVEAAYTACSSLFEQYGFQLENGAIAPDAVDAYIEQYQAELDAAGYQEVLAEFQNQYNTWKAQ